jgi:hypothetical protein
MSTALPLAAGGDGRISCRMVAMPAVSGARRHTAISSAARPVATAPFALRIHRSSAYTRRRCPCRPVCCPFSVAF